MALLKKIERSRNPNAIVVKPGRKARKLGGGNDTDMKRALLRGRPGSRRKDEDIEVRGGPSPPLNTVLR